jgi:DNA primase
MNDSELPDGIELPNIELLNEEELIVFADTALVEAGKNLTRRGEAINQICEQIFGMKDPVSQSVFIDEISKRHKISKKVITDRLKALKESVTVIEEKETDPFEGFEGVDRNAARKLGFFEHRNCLYFLTKDGPFRASNFVIRPLFHIYSKTDNKRLVEIINEYTYRKTVDIPSKSFVSLEQFQQAVFNEGNYIFFGSKFHFMRVLDDIANKFPVCNELKTLGWQREGFYAFANGSYSGAWQPVDEFGITEFEKKKYFSPAFSMVYADVREDDDEYESDRYFVWRQSPITFGDWTSLMMDVYGTNARIAIAFAIATVFRDLIYDKYKIFPHLFLFGEKQSGKSQLAWSLSNLFFDNKPAFNLSSGTQVGFHRNLSRIKNAICWWDEYSNDIDPKRIQTLKSAYDGMGHEKGKMTRDNRTEVTKVNSSSVISGQYLPTADDNALLTRSILLSFVKKTYSQQELARYDELKKFEKTGLSSLIGNILHFRKEVDQGFGMAFSELMERIKDELSTEGKQFEERLVRNFCCILAPVKIILDSMLPLELNFTFDEIYDQSKTMIHELSLQVSSSESLSNFWLMTEYLLDNKMIEAGKDFEIKSVASIRVTNKKGIVESLNYPEPKMVLFIRFSKIHPLYMEGHRKQFGKNGVDLVSLMHYIKHHQSYIGAIASYRFEDSVSSCYSFDYEGLNVNLERIQRLPGQDEQPF